MLLRGDYLSSISKQNTVIMTDILLKMSFYEKSVVNFNYNIFRFLAILTFGAYN